MLCYVCVISREHHVGFLKVKVTFRHLQTSLLSLIALIGLIGFARSAMMISKLNMMMVGTQLLLNLRRNLEIRINSKHKNETKKRKQFVIFCKIKC